LARPSSTPGAVERQKRLYDSMSISVPRIAGARSVSRPKYVARRSALRSAVGLVFDRRRFAAARSSAIASATAPLDADVVRLAGQEPQQ
jgi:hypothetical protein